MVNVKYINIHKGFIMDCSNKNVVILDGNKVWRQTLFLWFRHFGFNKINVFGDEYELYDYVVKNKDDIDLVVINFYRSQEGGDGFTDGEKDFAEIIKKLRKTYEDLLIFVVSANFINDNDVLRTDEMIRAIYAGCNRVTTKDIHSLKPLIDEHFKVRSDPDLIKKTII